jgi:hypothetical protein
MEIGNGWIDLCGMNFVELKFGARVCVDLVRREGAMMDIDWMDISIPFCIHTLKYAHDIRQLNILHSRWSTGSAVP